ncbi:MAG: hypothetical protein M3Z23_03080 [Acidobacteriota bacterium]|nr:hypothetical protein [Acidobacteriota bacterium]
MNIPAIVSDPAPPPGFEKLPAPGVQYRMNVATASSAPWVNANGWRLMRGNAPGFFYDVPGAAAALAAAEAFSYGAEAAIHTDDPGARRFSDIATILKQVKPRTLPAMANVGVIDDGSPAAGEIMNLLTRRNLLFKIVTASDPKLDVNVRPDADAARNPSVFAQKVRQQLTDSKRLLRIYGSEVVIGRLTGEGNTARLHLLNYDVRRSVYGLRVRVLGAYANIDAQPLKIQDYRRFPDATEFTLPELGVYSVIDLSK